MQATSDVSIDSAWQSSDRALMHIDLAQEFWHVSRHCSQQRTPVRSSQDALQAIQCLVLVFLLSAPHMALNNASTDGRKSSHCAHCPPLADHELQVHDRILRCLAVHLWVGDGRAEIEETDAAEISATIVLW